MEASYEIKKIMARKIAELQNGSPSSRGNMAKLRRGLGKDIHESTESWAIIYDGLPNGIIGDGDKISEAERAIHLALTLFAMHQQGSDTSVNIKGHGFGESVSAIIEPKKSNEDAVVRRFNSLITSDGIDELSMHLRGMIQLMKSSGLVRGFDYEQFAVDLYFFQFPYGMRNVKLTWGKQFYNVKKANKELEESEKDA